MRHAEIKIYDLTNKLLKSNKLTDNQIDISELEPGAYILEINNLYKKQSYKIIKQ